LSIITKSRPQPADEPAADSPAEPRIRSRKRRVAGLVLTVLAAALVLFALLAPNQPVLFTAAAFLRLPVEAIVLTGLFLVLPARPRGWVALSLGILLGLLTIVKMLDVGFWTFLNRQFDLVADWPLLDDGLNFVKDTFGTAGQIGAMIVAALLALGALVLTGLAMRRLAALIGRHRRAATGAGAVAAVAWVALFALGAQLTPGLAIAATSEDDFVHDRAILVRQGFADQKAFTKAIDVDRFRTVPGNQLLTGLAGKDVVVSFVESYGRSALEDPVQAAQVDPALATGAQQLAAAGFAAKSGFLTSPTFGGYSWLAHSTLQSGLEIDTQMRYRGLVSTSRQTLTGSFAKAGWSTVAVEPDNTYTWPEGRFYGYQRVWDQRNLGYQGPHFSWSTMPDQYTLAQFQKNEYGKAGRAPLMAEVTLTSSHTPWAPIPQLVDWDTIGDGSLYTAQQKAGLNPAEVWKDQTRIRTEYAKSVAYSVGSLVSWVQKYGKDNLVLVFLGDHQASANVSGQNATHDVPVTIVAKDPKVFDKIASWGWQDGLHPSPQAPVFPMNQFRDKFLTAFGS
jgi:phosphoglycerol transferase MdoB-like AlkP superfamily enzyme